LAHAVGVGWAAVVLDGQGHHGHVGVGEHLPQRDPGAMVQTASRVGVGGQASRLQRRHDLHAHFGAAGGGVLDLEEAGVKAAEVMDGVESGSDADGGHAGFPVGANDHNRARRGQLFCELTHGGAGRAGLQGKHGGAMGHEEDGQWRVHGDGL